MGRHASNGQRSKPLQPGYSEVRLPPAQHQRQRLVRRRTVEGVHPAERAQAALRIHKSDLAIRPTWHQKEERVTPLSGHVCSGKGLASKVQRQRSPGVSNSWVTPVAKRAQGRYAAVTHWQFPGIQLAAQISLRISHAASSADPTMKGPNSTVAFNNFSISEAASLQPLDSLHSPKNDN